MTTITDVDLVIEAAKLLNRKFAEHGIPKTVPVPSREQALLRMRTDEALHGEAFRRTAGLV